jgi:NAD-dependent deacetylase
MSTTIDLDAHANIVFFTGAGISAESGVPTYRGKGGIWKEFDFQNCACQEAFDRAPEHVWEFHNYRRELVSKCAPNRGHELIAQAEQERPGVTVVTQNIDGLHQLAGNTNVIELHGSLWRTRCDTCGTPPSESRSAPLEDLRCACGAYKRPDIVWFGDNLSGVAIAQAMTALANCDLLISIGTSAVVYPAAEMPLVAKRAGAQLVEINPEPTPISHAYDTCLRGTAAAMLEQLFGAPA